MNLHRMKTVFRAMLTTMLCVILLLKAKEAREGAADGIRICLSVLIPSLFPLMAVTNLLVNTGVCASASSALCRPANILFGVSGAVAPVLLLSLLGGYPVGAGGVASLYRQGVIGRQEAKQASLFCVCAGPGFIVSYIGEALLGSAQVGLLLFATQILSVLLTGITVRLFFHQSAEKPVSGTAGKPPALPFSQALVTAVTDAAQSMLGVCAFVVFFSALTEILGKMVTNAAVVPVLYTVLEVCGAVRELSFTRPLTDIAFAVGFGGICVHFQLFAALKEVKVNKLLFFLCRIIQGGLAALLMQIALWILPQSVPVFSTAPSGSPALINGSIISGTVLLTILICFFISVKQAYNRQ